MEDPIKCIEKCGILISEYQKVTTNLPIVNNQCDLNKLNNNNLMMVDLSDSKYDFKYFSNDYAQKKFISYKEEDIPMSSNNTDCCPTSSSSNFESSSNKSNNYCNICMNSFDAATNESSEINENLVKIACGHLFCRFCWEKYLTMKIDEGNVSDIVCPQVNCYSIVPHDVVERLISKETAKKYLHFDIRAFVDSNPEIKWCPYPGCGNAGNN